ncbi:unnamed protein product [Acanthoscelides obtectus]|uniref:Uncharacterized protein n=1 Tax=Acanthoscelides obtectus TaxID=200917 RepID=A0A9P0LUD7_ACAOB|nr:unnamed protein product [Acanthoscelides obtectus]CAK1665103.1 hypothetical protein AOBTE_LOCUS24658 [Acanthoscelides obtectus]
MWNQFLYAGIVEIPGFGVKKLADCIYYSRVQKCFLGSLLRYKAWRYPARISLPSV